MKGGQKQNGERGEKGRGGMVKGEGESWNSKSGLQMWSNVRGGMKGRWYLAVPLSVGVLTP